MKRNEFFEHISDDRMPDIEQIRLNCINQTTDEREKCTKRKLKPTLIIAAALMAVFTISAFAGIIPLSWHLGEILENLTFKGFDANKVEEFDPSRFKFSDDDTTSASDIISFWDYEITDPKVKEMQKFFWTDFSSVPPRVYFKTIEEAAEQLNFTPKSLNYIPEGYSFYDVSALKDEKDNYENGCFIRYISDECKEINKMTAADIALRATYVGENATIHVNTKQDIEQITLNSGIEALLMVSEYGATDQKICSYTIMWIKNEIGYSLSGSSFDREEIIKMAESVN